MAPKIKFRLKLVYVVIVVALLVIFLPGYAKFMELKAKNMHLEKEIERLERENLALYKEKKKLQDDIQYIEKVAREEMGVAKEGEIPIKIERVEKK